MKNSRATRSAEGGSLHQVVGRRLAQAKALTEAQEEWKNFERAIQIARKTTETFTNEALMLIHLAMGNEALRQPSNEKLSHCGEKENQ